MPRSIEFPTRFDEAKRLKKLRETLNLSQRELAKDFRVAHGAINFWEKGMRTIPGPVLKLIEIYEEELGMSKPPLKGKVLNELKSSWLSRTLRLSKMTTGMALRMTGESLQRALVSHERAALLKDATQKAISQQLATSLGELKGLMMKAGQMVSYMDFALPEQAREILSVLQDSTTPMAPMVIEEVIKEELGKTPVEIFSEWSPHPIAAASIGQVHKATLRDGKKVAVKIQYPGIAETLKTDLNNAAFFDKVGSVIFRNQEKGTFIAELSERLMEECDYKKEAINQEEFKRIFSDDENIIVPAVIPEYSTTKVLTTEFCEGLRFKDFSARASRDEKNHAAKIIWKVAFHSIFNHGILNADPHPGNYLFQGSKVVFLDFGCVKRFNPNFIKTWRRFTRAMLEQDKKTVRLLAIEIGVVPNINDFDFDYYYKMMFSLYKPWIHDKPFRFTHKYIEETWRAMITDNPNKSKMNLPKDWVFTNRLQWGLYSILAELEAEANWREIFLPLIYDKNEKRPKPFDDLENI